LPDPDWTIAPKGPNRVHCNPAVAPDPEKIAAELFATLKVKTWLSPGRTSRFVTEASPEEKVRLVPVVKTRVLE
jgi:hypothetical protein